MNLVTHTRFQRLNSLILGKFLVCKIVLFALQSFKKKAFVVVYVGKVIRRPVSDVREKQYKGRGINDSYMFRLSDHLVIDSIKKNQWHDSLILPVSRICTSTYSKIIRERGELRIVFSAKRLLSIGDEIKFEYQFAVEDLENKIHCLFKSKRCRRTLN